MAKKKAPKKSAGKKAAADTEMILLLPKETWDAYVEIRDNPELGQNTIDSMMAMIFGTEPRFDITQIGVASKDTYCDEGAPVAPMPRKC